MPPDPLYYYKLVNSYDGAEDVSEALNFLDLELTLKDLVEIRKKSAREDAEKPETDPEPKERTVTVWKLSEKLRLIEAGVSVIEESDGNLQRATATGQGLTRMLACCEEILKDMKKFLSPQT
jgi:hypothetical protein